MQKNKEVVIKLEFILNSIIFLNSYGEETKDLKITKKIRFKVRGEEIK